MAVDKFVAMGLYGLFLHIVLVVPFFLFVYRFFVRPLINLTPVLKYRRKGCYAIVTGASEGTGRAYATQLAQHGFNLIIVARRKDVLEQIKAELVEAYGVDVIVLPHDFSAPSAEFEAAVGGLMAAHDVSVLVNNVGRSSHAAFEELSGDDLAHIVSVNIGAALAVTRLFVQHSDAARPYLVLVMSSCTGLVPSPGNAVYASTKAFLHQFARSVSWEYPHVDVSVFTPWHISTSMIGNMAPSVTVPTAETFVRSALQHAGVERAITPYWMHHLELWGFYGVPEQITSAATLREFQRFRELRGKIGKTF